MEFDGKVPGVPEFPAGKYGGSMAESEGIRNREPRTIVTAGDGNYAWGVFLLIASAKRWKMEEEILVGAHHWRAEWLDFVARIPGVRLVELEEGDRACVAMRKPELMLRSRTDYVTWVDSDGIFQGNCSELLYGEPDRVYSRSYSNPELNTHTFARAPETVAAWIRDVGDLPARRDISDVCTNVVGVSLSHNSELLKRWSSQIRKVLPPDVGIVQHRNSPYFQTDESVLNSLLSCWSGAPAVTEQYRLNDPSGAYYIHFAYNPKPWQKLWTVYALRFHEPLMELIDWCRENDFLPGFEPLPPTLERKNLARYRALAPLAPHYCRFKKAMKKLGIR